MTAKINTNEGGTSGAAITTGNSGGDSGDAYDSVILNATYSNTRAAHGSLSCLANPVAASSSYVSWANADSTVYGRAYLYMTGAPPVNMQVVQLVSSSTLRLLFRVLTTRAVVITNSAVVDICTPSTTLLPLNQWNRIDWKAVVGTGTGMGEAQIFTTPNADTPAQTITATTVATVSAWDRVRYGANFSSSQTYSLWLDSLAISSGAFPGPHGPDGWGASE